MRKTKTLLKKATCEIARRARTCRNTNKSIEKGEACLIVFDGPRQRFCYSREVALVMIAEARKALNELEREFA